MGKEVRGGKEKEREDANFRVYYNDSSSWQTEKGIQKWKTEKVNKKAIWDGEEDTMDTMDE